MNTIYIHHMGVIYEATFGFGDYIEARAYPLGLEFPSHLIDFDDLPIRVQYKIRERMYESPERLPEDW